MNVSILFTPLITKGNSIELLIRAWEGEKGHRRAATGNKDAPISRSTCSQWRANRKWCTLSNIYGVGIPRIEPRQDLANVHRFVEVV